MILGVNDTNISADEFLGNTPAFTDADLKVLIQGLRFSAMYGCRRMPQSEFKFDRGSRVVIRDI